MSLQTTLPCSMAESFPCRHVFDLSVHLLSDLNRIWKATMPLCFYRELFVFKNRILIRPVYTRHRNKIFGKKKYLSTGRVDEWTHGCLSIKFLYNDHFLTGRGGEKTNFVRVREFLGCRGEIRYTASFLLVLSLGGCLLTFFPYPESRTNF